MGDDESDSVQLSGHETRILTDLERIKLSEDKTLVSPFKQDKLEREAQRNWDLFYKRNSTKFFKDRHWTTREFQELCGKKDAGRVVRVLEVGCGVGNFLFPLLREDSNLFFYACDFSPRAVQFVKDNELYASERCCAFQCDVTKDDLSKTIVDSDVDIATLVFVLSAIHPDKMAQSLSNIYQVLHTGGCVLFRDYGRYDHAMLRFGRGHKLAENFYVRQDGTRAYYFTTEELTKLFHEAGFVMQTCEYIMRKTVNKKEGLSVPRVFVQGRFVKAPPGHQNVVTPHQEQPEIITTTYASDDVNCYSQSTTEKSDAVTGTVDPASVCTVDSGDTLSAAVRKTEDLAVDNDENSSDTARTMSS